MINPISHGNEMASRLQQYNKIREMAQDLALTNLAIKRNYSIPKIRISTKNLRSQQLQGIITKEHIIEYVNDIEDEFIKQQNLSQEQKINVVNEQLTDWDLIKDKAFRDNIVGSNFLKDSDARVRGLAQKFLTGKSSLVKSTKKQQEELDEQKDILNKKMNELVRLKEKTNDLAVLKNIDDTLRYLTKTTITLDSINSPIDEKIFDNIVSQVDDIRNGMKQTQVLQIQTQDDDLQQEKIIERFDRLSVLNDDYNAKYREMMSSYDAISQETGKIIPKIEKYSKGVEALQSEIEKLFTKEHSNRKNERLDDFLKEYNKALTLIENTLKSVNQNVSPRVTSSSAATAASGGIEEVVGIEEFEEQQRKAEQAEKRAEQAEMENKKKTASSDKFKRIFGLDNTSVTGASLREALSRVGSEEMKKLIDNTSDTKMGKSLTSVANELRTNPTLRGYKPDTPNTRLASSDIQELMKQEGLGRKKGSGFPTATNISSNFVGNPPPLPRDNTKQMEKAVRHFNTINF
jgi:hypothetical protein